MTEQTQDAGRLICKIGEDGYVRERGDWIDISEDGQSGRTYAYVDQLVAVRQQLDQYRWRSVEDELPEKDGDYLLHYADAHADGFSDPSEYCMVDWWLAEWKTFDHGGKLYTGDNPLRITHWMPIPPLPDKEEG